MKPLSIVLAVIHSVAALVLLIFSGWFIAACAIAGIGYALTGFNYLLPAVTIRALALTRIASGYSQMWTGHHALLSRIKALRLNLFSRLRNKKVDRLAEGTEALARHSEAIASITMSWTVHNIAAFCTTIIASIVVILWLPEWTFVWCAFLFIVIMLFALTHHSVQKESRAIQIQTTQFRHESEHHLASAPIWHLYARLSHPDMSPIQQRILRQHGKSEHLLWLVQPTALSALIYAVGTGHYKGQAIAMILILLLLSAKDWLAPMIRSQSALGDYQQSCNTLQHLPLSEIPDAKAGAPAIETLSLRNFSAAGRLLKPIDLTIKKGEITLLKGSSGSGKTSLLRAIAGLLPHCGEKIVNQTSLPCGLINAWHYSDQSPCLLSASLGDNLRLAKPGADTKELREALDFADLSHLDNLSQWLGEQGRRLSGGELKRLAIARASLYSARLYLLDEPFEGLNTRQQQQLASAIQQLAQRAPVIIASHVLPGNLIDQTISILDLDE